MPEDLKITLFAMFDADPNSCWNHTDIQNMTFVGPFHFESEANGTIQVKHKALLVVLCFYAMASVYNITFCNVICLINSHWY